MKNKQSKLKIIGTGIYLPGMPVDNYKLSKLLKIDPEWIDYFIGTKERYFSTDIDTGKRTHTLSEMCVKASKLAIMSAGLNTNDIDAIILATATPDFLMPTTVNCISELLEINQVPTFQIQSGCSGAIQALDLACYMLNNNKLKNVLVIAGDCCNKFLDLTQDFIKTSRTELINYLLFGDGAAAIILSNLGSNRQKVNNLYIEHVLNYFAGNNKNSGQIIRWYGSANDLNNSIHHNEPNIFEDYKEIEKSVPKMAKEVLNEILNKIKWNKNQVNYILPPQLGKKMTEKILNTFNLNSEANKTINCVEYTGNNGNALPFIQIDQLFKTCKKGDRAILIAIESSKWIKSGVAFYVSNK